MMRINYVSPNIISCQYRNITHPPMAGEALPLTGPSRGPPGSAPHPIFKSMLMAKLYFIFYVSTSCGTKRSSVWSGRWQPGPSQTSGVWDTGGKRPGPPSAAQSRSRRLRRGRSAPRPPRPGGSRDRGTGRSKSLSLSGRPPANWLGIILWKSQI